jgi:hypothetical protein
MCIPTNYGAALALQSFKVQGHPNKFDTLPSYVLRQARTHNFFFGGGGWLTLGLYVICLILKIIL